MVWKLNSYEGALRTLRNVILNVNGRLNAASTEGVGISDKHITMREFGVLSELIFEQRG